MSAVVNLIIDKGTDFEESFDVSNPDGSTVPLTGFSAISKLKRFPESSTSTSFSVGINSDAGKVAISMGNTITSNLSPGRYYYDVLILSPDSKQTKIVEGMAMVVSSQSI